MLAPPSAPAGQWANGLSAQEHYFPLAVWLQDPKNAAKYQDVGLNLYIGLWKGPTQDQLDAASRGEMPVICEQNDTGLKNKDNKTIVGWMHGDEPDNSQSLGASKGFGAPIAPAKMVEEYDRMRTADPTRPVLLNLGQGVAWDGWYGRGARTNHPEDYAEYLKGCDIASFDIYPITHPRREITGNLWYVGYGVDRLAQWSQNQKPVWACIETTHISNPAALPTPPQVRAEVWMAALIHGARGIIYFSHEFKPKFIEAGMFAHPEIAAAVKEINAQIQQLAPVLNAPTDKVAATVASSSKDIPIALLCKRTGKSLYVFAIDERDKPASGSFRIAGLNAPAKINVIGEKRTIEMKEGRFDDQFDGYAAHLYRVGE